MKKLIFILCISLVTGVIFAQNPQVFKKDIKIYKGTPTLYLDDAGHTGAVIDFGLGDIKLTQTSNKLAMTGGVFDFSQTPTVGGASLSAIYASGDAVLGANNITMTGSIAATGARVTKGWFTNLEISNLPTIAGVAIHTNPIITGNLGINTSGTALHNLAVLSSRAINLNAFNFVMTDINKSRSTVSQTQDTSSFSMYYTYSGSPLLTLTDKNGNVLFRADSIGVGIGTTTPLTKFSVLATQTTNLNAFNFVQSSINKQRTTFAQATDTSSLSLSFTYTGNPTLNLTNKAGVSLVKVDSVKISAGVPMMMYYGDTTVTATPGMIVYKTSDSTFYGCRYKKPTGKHLWWALDH